MRSLIIFFFLFFVSCVILSGQGTAFSQSGLDAYFYPPERHGRMSLVVYRTTVSDSSPEWARVLLSGFMYAAAASPDGEMVAVGIKEQDMVTRVYSVRRTDLQSFLDERITIQDFVRRIYMARVPSR
jgi:hypothetical protein